VVVVGISVVAMVLHDVIVASLLSALSKLDVDVNGGVQHV
jgi:hypothetical protein